MIKLCPLSEEEYKLVKENPHTGQFFCNLSTITNYARNANKNKLPKYGITRKISPKKEFTGKNFIADAKSNSKSLIKYKNPNPPDRILSADYPQLPYVDYHNQIFTVIHWGQRKLLLSEIEFMTNYATPSDVVIYAGAAPGNHIEILARMFPENFFVLIDPRDFANGLKKVDNIFTMNAYLNETTSKEIKKKFPKKKILFISDIRTGADIGKKGSPSEQEIKDDMKLQKELFDILKPEYAHFKFRLPYSTKTEKYFDGTIYFQPWGRPLTAETRLVVKKNAKEKTYQNKKYEENMSYFNNIARCQHYDHNYNVEGMDHCYDCTAEFLIHEKYYDKYYEKYYNKYNKTGNGPFMPKNGKNGSNKSPNSKKNKNSKNKNKKLSKKEFVEKMASHITTELNKYGRDMFNVDYRIIEL